MDRWKKLIEEEMRRIEEVMKLQEKKEWEGYSSKQVRELQNNKIVLA